MKAALTVIALILVGCGNAPAWPDKWAHEYQAGCFHVLSELELDKTALEHNFQTLRAALGPVMKDDVCQYSLAPLHVLDVDDWSETKDGGVLGYYDPVTGITLSRRMLSWPHELLHMYDAAHYSLGTWSHPGWATNGYQAAINKYQSSSLILE
jgi:hypothetical protein